MIAAKSPYICHLFVCTNTREGGRKSCGDGDSAAIRQLLKEETRKRGWAGKVRVSQSGCLGQCAKGPNVMIYPHKLWFSRVSMENTDDILSALESIVEQES